MSIPYGHPCPYVYIDYIHRLQFFTAQPMLTFLRMFAQGGHSIPTLAAWQISQI